MISIWGDFSQLTYGDSETNNHFAKSRQVFLLFKFHFLPKFWKGGKFWAKTEIMIKVKVEEVRIWSWKHKKTTIRETVLNLFKTCSQAV